MMKSFLAIVVLLGVSLVFQSCDEVFPPYEEPTNVLVGTIQINSADTVDMIYDSGSYFTMSVLALDISVKNVYDNLLQGDAEVGGRVVLESFGVSPKTIVIPLAQGYLLQPPVFRGNIALPPNSEAKFSVQFLPIGGDTLPVYLGSPFTTTDSARIYGPIEFVASANVKLFQRVQPIDISNYRFSLYFRETTSQ